METTKKPYIPPKFPDSWRLPGEEDLEDHKCAMWGEFLLEYQCYTTDDLEGLDDF